MRNRTRSGEDSKTSTLASWYVDQFLFMARRISSGPYSSDQPGSNASNTACENWSTESPFSLA